MKNQRTATVEAILSVLTGFELGGEVDAIDIITDTQKTEVVSKVCRGFMDGEIEMSAEGKAKYFGNPSELRKYVVGLVNNWLRKAPELNGGAAYQPKNPGSRQGSGDRVLKALRALLKTTNEPEAKAEIEQAIQQRLDEIKPKVELDIDAIPERLRKFLK